MLYVGVFIKCLHVLDMLNFDVNMTQLVSQSINQSINQSVIIKASSQKHLRFGGGDSVSL